VFEKLMDGTILLGEMVLPDYDNHMEAFKNITKICRSDTEKALARQDELGKVSYKIFDLAFFKHKNWLTSYNYKCRYTQASLLSAMCGSEYIGTVKILDMTHTEAMRYVKDNGLEGLVVWDAGGVMKDGSAYTYGGKAYRPSVLWKSKPKYEDDFIAKFNPEAGFGEYGKGKNKGKIKNAFIYQIQNGEEVFLGRCAGGLSDKQRDFYTDHSLFPRVWRIEYDSIQPETGSLRYPVFNADRTLIGDKSIEECVMSDAIEQARKQEK
jgi:hypothetical protein